MLWAENHFSTWLTKDEYEAPPRKWVEHLTFLRLGPTNFRELLMASSSSPAMMFYLDQRVSLAGKINENYAREIMELHTVGVHGGYNQGDVTKLAGLLTGCTLSKEMSRDYRTFALEEYYRFAPELNVSNGCRIFGMEFPEAKPKDRWDRLQTMLDMLASHPSTAEFISRKLAEQYVSVPAPDSLVKKLSQRFQETGGDMTELLLTLSDSPEFWATIDKPKVATPLDFSLRLLRSVGSTNAWDLNGFLQKSNMGLFDRVTPDGYPEAGSVYADSSALLNRWRFSAATAPELKRLLAEYVPSGKLDSNPDLMQKMLDLASIRLYGHPLMPASNDSAMQFLNTESAPDQDRIRTISTLIAQLPESSLR